MSLHPIRIILVDDHPAIRAGLRLFIECDTAVQVVAEGNDGVEALDLIRRHRPHIAVIDLQMPNLSGLEVIRQARREGLEVEFLVLTAYDDDCFVVGALQAGAKGYLLKTAGPAELTHAIRRIHSGRLVLDPRIAERVAHKISSPVHGTPASKSESAPEHLSDRELDVLRHVAEGRTNRAVGSELGISERTVHSHLVNIFAKMHVNSRVEAVMKGLRLGWITIDSPK